MVSLGGPITEAEARKIVAEATNTKAEDWKEYAGPNCGHGVTFWFEGPDNQTAYVWCGSSGTPVMADVWVDGHPLHCQVLVNR